MGVLGWCGVCSCGVVVWRFVGGVVRGFMGVGVVWGFVVVL